MGVFAYVMFIAGSIFFFGDSYRIMRHVYQYGRKKGYMEETICYIKSPRYYSTRISHMMVAGGKWVVKLLMVTM